MEKDNEVYKRQQEIFFAQAVLEDIKETKQVIKDLFEKIKKASKSKDKIKYDRFMDEVIIKVSEFVTRFDAKYINQFDSSPFELTVKHKIMINNEFKYFTSIRYQIVVAPKGSKYEYVNFN